MEWSSGRSSLKRKAEELNKSAEEIAKEIDNRIKELEEKERKWEEIQKKMIECAETASKKIKLDIGGKIFTTSKSTLLSIPDTYFYAMLSSGHWKPDEDGEDHLNRVTDWIVSSGVYFVDRDPKHFDRILNFLRTGELDTTELSERSLKKLLSDLDYYQIPIPKEMQSQEFELKWDPSNCGRGIVISEDGKTAERTHVANICTAVIGTHPVSKFKIKFGGNQEIFVGFIQKCDFKKESWMNPAWELNLSGGCLYFRSDYEPEEDSSVGTVSFGSTVEVEYHADMKTISFTVAAPDGTTKTIAYNSINKTEDLYPIVEFRTGGAYVTLI